jgi:iron complex outermembrane receptor protein
LLYNINSKTSLLVQGDYMKNDMMPDFGIGTLVYTNQPSVIPTGISRSASFNTPWAFNKVKQVTSTTNLNHKLNDNWNLEVNAGFQSFDRNYFSTERIQALPNGDWSRKLTRSKPTEEYYTGQLNFSGKFKSGFLKHQLLLGADAEQYTNITNAYNISSLPTSGEYDIINILDPNKYSPRTDEPTATITNRTKAPTYRTGMFVQDLISLSEKLKVLAGLRYSYQKIGIAKITNVQTGDIVDNPSKATSVNDIDNAFSPRLGLVYQPVKNTSVFASYSNNFAPNPGIDINTGGNMKASFIDQFEVGLKNDFFGGRLSANFSLYKIINSNLSVISSLKDDGKPGNTDNNIKEFAGQTTSDGFEFDLNGAILPNLNFLAGYSYNYMRFTNGTDQPNSFVKGERLVNNPANTANASLFYTFNSSKIKGIKVGASAYYMGSRYGGYNNRLGQYDTKQPKSQQFFYDRLIPLKGYTTFDLSLGYSFKKLSFLSKISNITDELNYIVHENYSVNPIPPRQFVTTLSYKF